MTTQWIVSTAGCIVNLSAIDVIEYDSNAVWATEAAERPDGSHRCHLLYTGSEDECRRWIDQLANRIGAVDSRRWRLPA